MLNLDPVDPHSVDASLNKRVSLYYGDITSLKVDAIVNSTNPNLRAANEGEFKQRDGQQNDC